MTGLIRRVNDNNLVILPPSLRTQLGLNRGDYVEFTLSGEGVLMRKADLKKKLKDPVAKEVSTGHQKIQEWERAYGTGI